MAGVLPVADRIGLPRSPPLVRTNPRLVHDRQRMAAARTCHPACPCPCLCPNPCPCRAVKASHPCPGPCPGPCPCQRLEGRSPCREEAPRIRCPRRKDRSGHLAPSRGPASGPTRRAWDSSTAPSPCPLHLFPLCRIPTPCLCRKSPCHARTSPFLPDRKSPCLGPSRKRRISELAAASRTAAQSRTADAQTCSPSRRRSEPQSRL